jgi:CDP-paratose 2-epimerase
MRKYFFGDIGSTRWNRDALKKKYQRYTHYDIDVRDNDKIKKIFQKEGPFDLILHAAAQPSHDWAAKEPFTDFTINANGTLVMLENFRTLSPKAVFIFTSTNKVYGDTPNRLPLIELETRWEVDKKHKFYQGIDETMNIDNSLHSLFGAAKTAADILTQEYGRYFHLNTGIFRGGPLTGPDHSGAELHGFLAYLAKCIVEGRKYRVFGYKAKQVRDNIHSWDCITAFDQFFQKPRPAEVYNIGGTRYSHISMLEAIKKLENMTDKKLDWEYIEQNRIGDHMWYVSDMSKFKKHYPKWDLKYNGDMILKAIVQALEKRK